MDYKFTSVLNSQLKTTFHSNPVSYTHLMRKALVFNLRLSMPVSYHQGCHWLFTIICNEVYYVLLSQLISKCLLSFHISSGTLLGCHIHPHRTLDLSQFFHVMVYLITPQYYSSWRVLAYRTIYLHSSLSCATLRQLLTPQSSQASSTSVSYTHLDVYKRQVSLQSIHRIT